MLMWSYNIFSIEFMNSTKEGHRQYGILSSNLRSLMNKDTIDSISLGEKTGVAPSTINSIRRGGCNPTLSTITAIARYFQLSISELTEKIIDDNLSTRRRACNIPVLAMKNISEHLKKKNYSEQMIVTELEDTTPENFFAVSLDNNSLYPLFEKGTLFIVKKTDQVLDGDVVLVDFGNSSYCFRRIFIESDKYFFSSLNGTLQSSGSHATNFIIVGIVIKAIQNF